MKFQFEPNLEYQQDAINAVVDIFDGQPASTDLMTELSGGKNVKLISDIANGNQLRITDQQIADNVHKVQARNKLELSGSIKFEEAKFGETEYGSGAVFPPADAPSLAIGNNFTVEMETGTGKTYVYLRTIHELRQKYNFKKFIIVVPSIAIKEGVLKNLEITKDHFAQLYSKPEMDYYMWDSKKRGMARQFATNDTLQIMVVTIQSFTRDKNIMRQASDYGKPIEFIRSTNPIVIIDEPQNLGAEREKAIEELNPLCTLRYSATHKNYYNLLYKLDPVEAYDKGLVKKIEVDSIYNEQAFNDAHIVLNKIEHQGKSGLVAHIEIDKDDAAGLQRKVLKLSPGDDLQDFTGRQVYEGYILDSVDNEQQMITFANKKSFYKGRKNDSMQEDILRYQIERTIENHLDKELKFLNKGIKVLSLFFIDKVANYRTYNEGVTEKGQFAKWFEESYQTIINKPKYADLPKLTAKAVHDGYFAADKKGNWKDTRGETKADNDAYELIMKQKEKLLNLSEPLRFIFSHSALREGWDNPNVFQICTLNETSSELKKRQEIGRGLRLPVDADLKRIRDDNINILTVIANESYEDFSRKLQTEIEEETGVSFKNRVKNKQNRVRITMKKHVQLDESFKELWGKIKHRTRYSVEFENSELVDKTVKLLDEVVISKPKIRSSKNLITSMGEGFVSDIKASDYYKSASSVEVQIPDVLSRIQNHTKLTRKTIWQILDSSNLVQKILVNPEQVIEEVVKAIDQSLRLLMVDGVKYELSGEVWDMCLFENKDLEKYLDNLVSTKDSEKTIYDFVPYDSSTIEKPFIHDLEANDHVRFYIKLPGWFEIDTPLGKYNPDWAVVLENDKRVYFVAETKGTDDANDLHLSAGELGRIKAASKHFNTINVPYVAPVATLKSAIEGISRIL